MCQAGAGPEPLTLTLWQASAFIMFPDIYSSCRGASILRDHTAVDAVEMFDRASLRSAAAWFCGWCQLCKLAAVLRMLLVSECPLTVAMDSIACMRVMHTELKKRNSSPASKAVRGV